MTCLRCDEKTPGPYCGHCLGVLEDLKKQWTATFYDLFEEMLPHIKDYFHELDEHGMPICLEPLVEAIHRLGPKNYRFYHQRLKEIYEAYMRPQPGEIPDEAQIREDLGDERYHEAKDEGRLMAL